MTQISVNCILDSVNPFGNRLTTFELTIPRIILPQLTRHRQLSFSVASSRAIPLAKFRELATYTPERWMANGRGMSPAEELDSILSTGADIAWEDSRLHAIQRHHLLEDQKVHKEQANRLLEPFAMVKVLVSATEWDNFLNLRLEDGAQSEIREVARGIGKYLLNQKPYPIPFLQWHRPYFGESENNNSFYNYVSAGRCARVSYLNHGEDNDERKDYDLAQRLKDNRHLSPFEHVAISAPGNHANFKGWIQMRSFLSDASLVDQSWKEKILEQRQGH